MAKAAGNSYSPRLQPGTEVLLYWAKKQTERLCNIQNIHALVVIL
jgi:hypothetical protein